MATSRSGNWVVGLVTLLAALIGGGHVVAQDQAYTATVQAGECGVTGPPVAATAVATPQPDPAAARQAHLFSLTLDITIAELAAEPHALTIDVEGMGVATGFACAELTGSLAGDRLVVAVVAVESGELAGIAVLRPDGDDRVVVDVYLVLAVDGAPLGGDDGEDAVDDGEDASEPDDGDPEGGV